MPSVGMQIIKHSGAIAVFDIGKICSAIDTKFEEMFFSEEYSEEERANYHRYVRIMAEIDWPAYLNGETLFHEYVVEQYEKYGENGVVKAIFEFYDALYLKNLEDQMKESEVIKQDRIPLFHEAFLLYQLGYFYGAVSILIPQIVGITADIEKYMKKHNTYYDPVTMRLIKKRYGLNSTNEMSRVLTAVLEGKAINDEEGEYGFLMGYLRFKIFKPHLSKNETLKHPNRNLICHGAQLNYGTKEHAMKVILCIDSLAWVAEMIAEDISED